MSPIQNRTAIEKQKDEIFRQDLIAFIKKQDNSYANVNLSAYSLTQLVLLKVNMEIRKK